MKGDFVVRSDFVSNSSSCSFIISAEDNEKYHLMSNYDILTLKEYLCYCLDDELTIALISKEFNTVDNKTYNIIFSHSNNFFPEELKDDIIDFIDKYNNGLLDIDKFQKKKKNLSEKLFNILKDKWGDKKFHRVEFWDDDYDAVQHIDPWKMSFYRRFSHH